MGKRQLLCLTVPAVLLAVSILISCSGREKRASAPPQMPDWCIKQSGVVSDQSRGHLIVGVGAVTGIKSPAMARVNADGQARAEIAKIFNSYTENLLKQYQRSTRMDDKTSEEQDFMQATRIFSKLNVRGAAIEDRYVDEKTNTWYSKAVIPFDKFNDLIQANEELSEKIRQYVRQNADQAFKELDDFSAKQK